MSRDSISVLIPTHNYAHFIVEAIDSVLRQSVKPLEIVVVDDGSTDNTREVVGQYGDKVRYVHQPASGVAVARNRCLEEAQGEWISFLDADDIWVEDKLKLHTEWFEQHPESSICVGKLHYFLQPGHKMPATFRPELMGSDVDAMLLSVGMVKSEVFDKIGNFDASFSIGEDTDWIARAVDSGYVFHKLPQVVTRVRVHTSSTISNAPQSHHLLFSALRSSILRKQRSQSSR